MNFTCFSTKDDKVWNAVDLIPLVEALKAVRVREWDSQPRHFCEVRVERLLIPVARNKDDLETLVLCGQLFIYLDKLRCEPPARWAP